MTARATFVAATLLAFSAGCGHSFAEVTGKSLRGTLEATNGVRDVALEGAKLAQERIVSDLAAEAAALPGGPERDAKVSALKAQARADVTEIRAHRDLVLSGCAKSYRAIAMAQVLLPLADNATQRAEIRRLLRDAYDALAGTAP